MPPVKTCRSGSLLLPLLLSLAIPSCSVLEDREDCPCRLRVEIRKRCRLTPEREVRLQLRSEVSDACLEASHTLSELQDRDFELSIPKGTVRADGFVGLRRSVRENDCLMIPDGTGADSLYWVSGVTEALGEKAILPLRIRKEYAGITLRFLFEEEGPFPYSPVIRGSTSGIRLTDGSPVAGSFRCVPEETDPGTFRATLPRQTDPDGLVLELRRKKDPPDGTPLSVIPIGRLILSSGAFSWEDEDLKDLRFDFDYAHSQLTLQVLDWELGECLTFII